MAEKYVEKALTDGVNTIGEDEEVDYINDANVYDDLVVADMSWRVGKRLAEGMPLPKVVNQLLEEFPMLANGQLSLVLSQAEPAYKDPNVILALDNGRGQMRWMPKETAEENNLPYVRSVKQAVQTMADAYGKSYGEMADIIAPNNYNKYLNQYDSYEGVGKIAGDLVVPRNTELNYDPQLASKDGARAKAVTGDTAEMAAGVAPIGWMGKGWKGVKSLKEVKDLYDKASRTLKGAGAGAAAGAASYGAGLAVDKAMDGNRDERKFDLGEAALATGAGAVLGGIGGRIQPETGDDAARRILYKQTNGEDAKALGYNGYGDVKDELVKAARNHEIASDYIYRPMNEEKFEGGVYKTLELPKRGRTVQPWEDAETAGKYVPLEDSPYKTSKVSSGSGLEFNGGEPTKADIANYNMLMSQRKDYENELRGLQMKKAAVKDSQRKPVQQYDYDSQLAEINDQLVGASDAKTDRLNMKRAALEDKMKKASSDVAAKNDAISASNAAKANANDAINQRMAFLEGELAKATPEIPVRTPRNVRLVGADAPTADAWIAGYNELHPDNPIPAAHRDNVANFLTRSQTVGSPEHAIATNNFSTTKHGFNRERGSYKYDDTKNTYDNFMRDHIFTEPDISGNDELAKDFAKAKGETHKRFLETNGGNKTGGYVGGANFNDKVAKRTGDWNKTRHVVSRLPYAFEAFPADNEEDLTLIPKKKK